MTVGQNVQPEHYCICILSQNYIGYSIQQYKIKVLLFFNTHTPVGTQGSILEMLISGVFAKAQGFLKLMSSIKYAAR